MHFRMKEKHTAKVIFVDHMSARIAKTQTHIINGIELKRGIETKGEYDNTPTFQVNFTFNTYSYASDG